MCDGLLFPGLAGGQGFQCLLRTDKRVLLGQHIEMRFELLPNTLLRRLVADPDFEANALFQCSHAPMRNPGNRVRARLSATWIGC